MNASELRCALKARGLSKKGLVTRSQGGILRFTLSPRVKRGLCGDDGFSAYRFQIPAAGRSQQSSSSLRPS